VFTLLSCDLFTKNKKEEPYLGAEASFNKANELLEEGYEEDARELLEKVTTRDTSLKYAVLARLRIADSYFDEESYEEAAVEYESFLSLYPYHKYAPYAQYQLAMSYYKRIKTVDVSYSWAQKALTEFRKLQRQYPRNPYMDIIDNRVRACLEVLAEYEFYVGNFYFNKGSYIAAIGRFDGMLKNYPHSSKVPEALYYAGVSHEYLGQREEALNKLNALIKKYPGTELSLEAKKLIDSFYDMPHLKIKE
jgi:outer membrane protein assembly factor BamD